MFGFNRKQGLVFLAIVLLAAPLLACSVPVFRYALERWPSDPYVAVVFHRGPLTAEQQKVVDALGREGLAGVKFANVAVQTVDLDAKDVAAPLQDIWKPHEKEELPRIVLRYPHQTRIALDAWSGSLSMESAKAIIDSPVRSEIAQRIVKGDSAVFLFLESGDKEKDEARFEVLTDEVQKQQETLKLPEIDPADVAQGNITGDPDALKIRFSIMRLSREAEDEQLFVNMLLGTEEDLHELSDEPMVFPIFGRGRALYAIVGKGINEDVVATAGADLTGPCTCTVKDQNPGVDLLMALDWESVIEPIDDGKEPVVPTLTGLTGFGPEKTENVDPSADGAASDAPQPDAPAPDEVVVEATPAASGDAEVAPTSSPFGLSKILIIALAALLVIGMGGMFAVSRSKG